MQKKRTRTLALTIALASLAADVAAIGFGQSGATAVLGQPLDHVVAIRLDADESLSPDCVSAEVSLGDLRLPASVVGTRIEQSAGQVAVRVMTTVVVDEPVVNLSLSVGCVQRMTRRFVLLADPPAATAPSAPIAPPVETVLTPPAAPARPRPPAAITPEPAAPASAPAPAVTPRRADAEPAPPRARAAPRRVRPVPTEPSPPAAQARSRLKLDAVEAAELSQARAEAAQVAASAAIAAAQQSALQSAEAASAAAQRIAALEKVIERMRTEAIADREALKVLRQRAAGGDATSAWLPYLTAAVVLLALLSAWLAFKLRRLQNQRQMEWWSAAEAAETGDRASPLRSDPPEADTLAQAPTSVQTMPPVTRPQPMAPPMFSPAADTEPPPSPAERTQVLPPGWRDESMPARDVSIEELIDLEQQAEFFTVLGQEEAAIDLLVDHLRSTGGGSPMPYLKLLDIYRRRGDRESYDRMRAKFNHRFNAYAPDWDADASEGRSLEDYPSIVARLQMAWPSPIDAMAELESLLFRKSRGDLFDLPAYRDVLFLYSLARDLLDREPVDAGNVDVLLPISDGTEFTQPMSLEDSPSVDTADLVSLDNQPTVPVDLDITQPNMPESLFGENATDPGPARPRRRP